MLSGCLDQSKYCALKERLTDLILRNTGCLGFFFKNNANFYAMQSYILIDLSCNNIPIRSPKIKHKKKNRDLLLCYSVTLLLLSPLYQKNPYRY